MNPLAKELNSQIGEASSASYDLLSLLGKEIFFPKGILSQSAEAKAKANKYNATIGIAMENGAPMHLPVLEKYFNNLSVSEIFPYAPPAGRPNLRKKWKDKMIKDNPSMEGKKISNPVVTNALTHGLSICADLFADTDDVVISPDKLWGNYRLTFETRRGAKIATFPLFKENGFNMAGFAKVLSEEGQKRKKLIVLLNFPNNPTGYTPTANEVEQIVQIIREEADKGTKILTISDDAYFKLFFEETYKESLFGKLADLHENVLAIKLDGATKESYVWGWRIGFITFGAKTPHPESLYTALEKKVMGIIRGTISNCPHPSQSIIERAMDDPAFEQSSAEKFEILRKRALKVKSTLSHSKYKEAWDYYPFNSGYFMCLKLKNVNAEQLRVHLLDKYGVGTISIGATDLRIAFSCIEEESVEELFDLILAGVKDLTE